MKVLCINDSGWIGQWRLLFGLFTFTFTTDGPAYLEECIVIHEKDGYYQLERYGDDLFIKKEFIPLSEIDETEMQREYKFQPKETRIFNACEMGRIMKNVRR